MAKKGSKIAVSKSKRTGIALKTAAAIGFKKAKSSAGQLINPNQARKKAEEQDLAETLFRGLCQLRGTALKIAQAICGESDLLPASYMEVLERSQYRVPALNPVLAAKVIRMELGQEPEKIFAQFSRDAFAAASLGQVHRATSHDGQSLAVKIQYPGIDATIRSDLTMARALLAPIRHRGLAVSVLDEVEARLNEEVDYRLEAAHAREFAQTRLPSGIIVPGVRTDLSGRTVIAYEFIDGLHLSEWLATRPSQESRDHVAQRLFDFFTHGLFDLGMIHSDPNLGNFMVLDAGKKVAVLDFGSVKKISAPAVALFAKLATVSDEPGWRKQTLELYARLGADVQTNEDEFLARLVLPYAQWLDQLFLEKNIDFTTHPNVAESGRRILMNETFHQQLRGFSAEFTMLHRTFLGLLRVFSKLDARVDFRSFRKRAKSQESY